MSNLTVIKPGSELAIDNDLELKRYTLEVQTKAVQNEISGDFVMAKFDNEIQKEGIIELITLGYQAKRRIQKTLRMQKWTWQNGWQQTDWDETEKTTVEKHADGGFMAHMIRPVGSATLNRNKQNNWSIVQVMQPKQEERKEQEAMEDVKGIKKLVKGLKRKENEDRI